ncbi:MAG TPA: sigma-70 family RNA polymerase sigma factor [Acidobacteriota bacterium]|nr:sigma-70 family RNA polymerase sigma factor [Acidobacteriota bacterium]
MERQDKALVQRMLKGEETAFDEFFTAYSPGLYRFALARLNKNEDYAEEIVQITLCKAISKLKTYRGEAALFSWLCTFCRHEISAYYKRNRINPQPQLLDDTPDIRAALESLRSSTVDDPAEATRKKELVRMVHVALDCLPRHYGDALEWKYIEGFSISEIAAKLRVSNRAVESILARARAAFRDAFVSVTSGVGELNSNCSIWERG